MTISRINRLDNLYCLLTDGKKLNMEQQRSFNFLIERNSADIEDPVFLPEEWGIVNKGEVIEV